MENFIKLIEQCTQSSDTKKMATDLKFIQGMLNLILSQIKIMDSKEESVTAFALLEDVQFVLAKAAFKNKITLTPALNKFITDFDRIDDNDVKEFLHLKIKSGEYAL